MGNQGKYLEGHAIVKEFLCAIQLLLCKNLPWFGHLNVRVKYVLLKFIFSSFCLLVVLTAQFLGHISRQSYMKVLAAIFSRQR